MILPAPRSTGSRIASWVEEFSSTRQLVTFGLVDSSIGAMAKLLTLVNLKALVAEGELLSSRYKMGHCVDVHAARSRK